jgi:hypothetical protein
MVSAISSAGGGYTLTSGASRSDGGARLAEAEAKVDAKKIEIAQCSCADTRQSLREELSTLEADLNSALAQDTDKTGNRTAAGAADNDKRSGNATPNAASESANQLSGERERIGTVNFDGDTPFGSRVAYV